MSGLYGWLAGAGRIFVVTLGLIALAMPANAGRGGPHWAELESELTGKGVATDVASVIAAARRNPDAGVRWLAVELLGRRGDVAGIAALREILAGDPDRTVRQASALALARLGEKSAIGEVKKQLEAEPEPARRVYLATQLLSVGDASGFPYLKEAGQAKDERLRSLAIAGLVRSDREDFPAHRSEAQDLLLSLAKDSSSTVRAELLLQLSIGMYSGLEIEPFLPVVQSLAKGDSDAQVREQARLFLVTWEEAKRSRE